MNFSAFIYVSVEDVTNEYGDWQDARASLNLGNGKWVEGDGMGRSPKKAIAFALEELAEKLKKENVTLEGREKGV